MPSHDLDYQKNNGDAFFARLKKLEDQVRRIRTVQEGGGQAFPVTGYPGPGQVYPRTVTLAANTQTAFTFAVRTEGALSPTLWEPSLAVYVDTDGGTGFLMPDMETPTSEYLWPEGGLLTTDQRKLFYSLTRNGRYGLFPQDPENIGAWVVQLWNLGSSSHTYYLKIRPFGASSLGPLDEV